MTEEEVGVARIPTKFHIDQPSRPSRTPALALRPLVSLFLEMNCLPSGTPRGRQASEDEPDTAVWTKMELDVMKMMEKE